MYELARRQCVRDPRSRRRQPAQPDQEFRGGVGEQHGDPEVDCDGEGLELLTPYDHVVHHQHHPLRMQRRDAHQTHPSHRDQPLRGQCGKRTLQRCQDAATYRAPDNIGLGSILDTPLSHQIARGH